MVLQQAKASIRSLLKVSTVAALLCLGFSSNAIAAEARTFTTWNINGATLTNPFTNLPFSKEEEVMGIMESTRADVMCLNEAGRPETLFADGDHPWSVQYHAPLADPAGVRIYKINNNNQLWGWLVWRQDQADGSIGNEYRASTKQSDMILIRNSVADSKWSNISHTQAPQIQTRVIQNGKRRALLVQNNDTIYGCYHANPGNKKLERTVEVIDYRNEVAEYASALGSGDKWIAMGDMNITPTDLRNNERTAGPLWGSLGAPSSFVSSGGNTYRMDINPNDGSLASQPQQALDWFMIGAGVRRLGVPAPSVTAAPVRFRERNGNQIQIIYKGASDHAPTSVGLVDLSGIYDELRRR